MHISNKSFEVMDAIITNQKSEIAIDVCVLTGTWKTRQINSEELFVKRGKFKTYGIYNFQETSD